MKKLLLIAICLTFTMVLFAQSNKVGYIDTDRIMVESNMTQDAQREFMTYRQEWETQITNLDNEIRRLEEEYESKRLILTEARKQEEEERIRQKRRERDQLIENIFGENGLAMQRNAELLEPIMTKLRDAIEAIAIENDYAIIFDAIGGGILYAKPNLDLTDIVIEELNK